MFGIYTTTGSYPNLEKATLLFSQENVTISGGTSKTTEDDVIPLETFPDVWDSYTINKNVTVGGVLHETSTETVGDQYKKIDKIMIDYANATTWTDQPVFDNIEDRDVLAFVFYIPKKDGSDEEIVFYGILDSFTWNFASGAPHMNYELKFKCFARRWIL